MEVRKRIIPNNSKNEPIAGAREREFIYFTVKFNRFRDVSGSTANEVLDKEDIRECECALALPESYTDTGEETPLILSFHGAGSTVSEADNMIGGIPYAAECIKAGYAALDISGAEPHGCTMGCPEHLFAAYKAYRYAIKHFNLSERVLLTGGSMGGQVAINFANMFPGIVIAMGICIPRLNIDGVTVGEHYCIGTWDKTTPNAKGISTRDKIIDVYRLQGNEWDERNTVGFNPYKIRSFINSEGKRVTFPPCPIKIWQGMEDKTVDPVMIEEFTASVRRGGCYIETHMLEGVGHALTDVMKKELLMWFNRFI